MVGLGKLGLPVALALEHAGHEVSGWDASERRREQIEARRVPEAAHEPHVAEYLAETRLRLQPILGRADVILIAVQTPHKPEFEGCTPLEREPEDFDYTTLREAVDLTARMVRAGIDADSTWNPLVVVISTCLPGTFDRDLRPVLFDATETYCVEVDVPTSNARFSHRRELREVTEPLRPIRFAYMPLFIAMGSVIRDFTRPEFILTGADSHVCPPIELMAMLSPVVHRNPLDLARPMSITSAELTKVAYNAWLGYKLMLANGLAELSDKVGANVDDVLGTLKLATDRLVSTRYMDAGMGDGGGCHPRDQIALSKLAKNKGLSHDTFDVVIRAREEHARWLADLWCDEADASGLPMMMLGQAYKAGSTITTGSAARLVLHYARARGRAPVILHDFPGDAGVPPGFCSFLGTPQGHFLSPHTEGVVVDPWGLFPEGPKVRVVRPGRRA